MNEEQSKFNTAFADKGGIFLSSPEFLKIFDLRENIGYYANHIKTKFSSIPYVNGDFIQNDTLNACASKDINGNYYLGVYFGSFFLIRDMFTKMFASKSVLSHLGNPDLETDDLKTLNARVTRDGQIAINLYDAQNACSVNDPFRKEISSSCIIIVMDFLIMHELGHIINGHLGFYKKHFGLNSIEELNYTQPFTKIELLTIQTLEMDADSFAVNFMYNRATALIGKSSQLKDSIKYLYSNFETYFENFAFALYCFFKLCGYKEFSAAEVANLDHPPAAVRMGMIMDNVCTLLIHRKAPNSNKVAEAMIRAAKNAEEAFSQITYFDNTLATFLKAHSDSHSYMSVLADNWKNVRPLIEPHAFATLAAIIN